MGTYAAIAEVGESLVQALWDGMRDDPQISSLVSDRGHISLESPADLKDDNQVGLSLYLFRIVEDPNTKNQPPVPGNGGRRRNPPLTLDLHYLVTPMFGRAEDRQTVLGRAMQILNDHAILSGPDVIGSLTSNEEEVRVMLNPVSLEQLALVWQAMNIGYRLSVCYIARVAIIDSQVERSVVPVLNKRASYGQLVQS